MPHTLKPNSRKIWSAVFLYGYIALVMFLCLIRIEGPENLIIPTILHIPIDKWVHFFMLIPFPVFIFLFRKWHGFEIDKGRFFFQILCLGALLGLLIEVLQGSVTTYRGEDPYDLLADSIGTLAGLFLVLAFGTTIEKWIGKLLKI